MSRASTFQCPPEFGRIERERSKKGIEDYFFGPRDIERHSKIPRALRMHGSVAPKLILPTICVALWAALISAISQEIQPISVHPIVITVLGLMVGLALNFRSATAYERYMDGRRLWAYLGAISQNLARVIWVHTEERAGAEGKEDLIAKITCLNMIIAFAIALKHRLRFEPYTQYKDLQELVSHLDTFSRSAGTPTRRKKKMHPMKRLGLLLQIPMARSNPRKEIKQATRPLGNLPMEILSYMSAYVNEIIKNKTLAVAPIQQHAMNNMQALNEILAHTDRILNTPLPVAYNIAISQITWVYVITLPFQLVHLMGWIAVPVTTIAAYIIFGMHAIGNEIENPFGPEVNDLPMELYCAQIASDVTIISSRPAAKPHEYWRHPDNKPLYPISSAGYDFWASKSESDIRNALHTRAAVSKSAMCKRQSTCRASGSTASGISIPGSCDDEDGKDPVSPTFVRSSVGV
ncbi:UPF0187-domain-containing protein [Lophiostoma macrostomum CBS 122681]|uniref:UPF0187-domain-containing protein n=1 Tax=Lophiostoma macrostomum CBS 122681 TaxID=1314788 RepID=A0A6A6SZP2_9PLEO|nr:UPF0187-domain-containing protein [Lophiostoma macrostomum CBS 122681]